ncbi:amidase family protein [Streptomyces sp. NPDC057908]|uniref:amidase family protein n=1 Tax=Streptomyces sp. NPDC057908 TaxID=3346276 RepID=UPI0036EB7248
MSSLHLLTATELAERVRRREVSSREVVQAHLDRIERVNGDINAIVTLVPEQALAEADRADRAMARGLPKGPLHGVPVVHKDLHDTAGVRTTYGSTIYADHVPTRDARIVTRMRQAGAICLGKTNTPEFGTGSQTYNTVFGPTRNPYDPTKTAGGSSGGSAAALSAHMTPLAGGTDMGGSLRNPAGFCNVVGLRPSAGLVPSSEDWCGLAVDGPMARTVQDVALMLSVIAGHAPASPLSWPGDGSRFRDLSPQPMRGVRVAWGRDLGGLPVDRRVTHVLETVGRPAFEDLGCVVEDREPDFTGAEEAFRTWRAWYYAQWFGEEDRAALNPDTLWNIDAGLGLSGADLARAEQRRIRLYAEVSRFFEDVDVLALPVSQVPPFSVDLPWPDTIEGVPQTSYLDWMRSAYFISATGLPAISGRAGSPTTGCPSESSSSADQRATWNCSESRTPSRTPCRPGTPPPRHSERLPRRIRPPGNPRGFPGGGSDDPTCPSIRSEKPCPNPQQVPPGSRTRAPSRASGCSTCPASCPARSAR